MKTFALCLAAFSLWTPFSFGQADVIARQRAKALADQNNARQAQPAAPAPNSPPPAPTPMVTPPVASKPNAQQQHIAKLKAALAGARTSGKVSDPTKQEFAKDLLGTAQGSGKPSAGALSRLAGDLLTALSAKNVTAAADEKLVQKMVVLVNSAGLSVARTQEIADEAQAALQSAGVSATDAAKIAGDLQAVAADVRQTKP